MLREATRTFLLVFAVGVGMWICGRLSPLHMSPRGVPGPTLWAAQSTIAALLALIIALLAASAIGAAVSRASNSAVGMFALGGSLYGLAWRMGTAGDMIHLTGYWPVAFEMLLWAALALGGAWLVFTIGGTLPDVEPLEPGHPPHPLLSRDAWKMFACGAIAIPVVWLMAQHPGKGQALGAAIVAGTAAGLVGRLIAPHVQPVLIFAAPVFFGGIGYGIVAVIAGSDALGRLHAGTLPGPGLLVPADWLVGSCMGVAMGLGWAKSFLKTEEEETVHVRRTA